MPTPSNLDGVLVRWGNRLFYPGNRVVHARTPRVTGAGIQERALPYASAFTPPWFGVRRK